MGNCRLEFLWKQIFGFSHKHFLLDLCVVAILIEHGSLRNGFSAVGVPLYCFLSHGSSSSVNGNSVPCVNVKEYLLLASPVDDGVCIWLFNIGNGREGLSWFPVVSFELRGNHSLEWSTERIVEPNNRRPIPVVGLVSSVKLVHDKNWFWIHYALSNLIILFNKFTN